MKQIPFVVLLCLATNLFADEGHHHHLTQQEIGEVHFATSCNSAVQPDFDRAVALLHSFQYEQSRGVFESVAESDPKCAMAYWGIAMTHYHGLWKNGDLNAGRVAWEKSNQIAFSVQNTTTREKDYIDALGSIYAADGADEAAHALAYAKKMEALHASNLEDSETTIFYALSLDVTAPKTDKTFANQRHCGELLEPIFQKQPHHPGVAHYIIHCYDNPALAEKGLGAARAYATIAPASAHAQHMPSHIFTRVGLWDESIESNTQAKLSATAAEKTSTNGEARDQRLHAMDYLEYAYLQRGMDKEAKLVLDEMNSLDSIRGLTLTGNYALSAIPARYAIERQDWKSAQRLKPQPDAVPWAQALTWLAIGEGSARAGDRDMARNAEQQLAALRDKALALKNTYWGNQIEVQRLEVGAWSAQAAGKTNEAISLMRSAADLEESMDKDAVTPGAITPGREMLAELLSANKQSTEALAEFEQVLKVAPNRFNALYGAATAAESSGQRAKASLYYAKLANLANGTDRPQVAAARSKLIAVEVRQ